MLFFVRATKELMLSVNDEQPMPSRWRHLSDPRIHFECVGFHFHLRRTHVKEYGNSVVR